MVTQNLIKTKARFCFFFNECFSCPRARTGSKRPHSYQGRSHWFLSRIKQARRSLHYSKSLAFQLRLSVTVGVMNDRSKTMGPANFWSNDFMGLTVSILLQSCLAVSIFHKANKVSK